MRLVAADACAPHDDTLCRFQACSSARQSEHQLAPAHPLLQQARQPAPHGLCTEVQAVQTVQIEL